MVQLEVRVQIAQYTHTYLRSVEWGYLMITYENEYSLTVATKRKYSSNIRSTRGFRSWKNFILKSPRGGCNLPTTIVGNRADDMCPGYLWVELQPQLQLTVVILLSNSR